MPISFVHLSDIHFGQEKGSTRIIHDDVKERLIEDATQQARGRPDARLSGIIVSGDIAYSGKSDEYKLAAAWLDRLAAAVGCKKTDVQVVPGNHDIDFEGISSGCKLMLSAVAKDGELQLDDFLEAEIDREALYNRFAAYRPFAEGYDCPLDRRGGIASQRIFELAPGRSLNIIGLNSALICGEEDKEGRLLLGARQRVLPRHPGQELVIVCHHPLRWLQDSDEARRYVKNRARVFVSGHEHNPSLRIENIKPGCDLLTLEAGATVPPRAENGYTYTYNLLTFEWDDATDGLSVTVIPRAWSEDKKDFIADDQRLGANNPKVLLGCPNFRESKTGKPAAISTVESAVSPGAIVATATQDPESKPMNNDFPLLLLKFFRDLSPRQRLSVLMKLKLLPEEWRDPLTHTIERQIVDRLERDGRLSELESAMNEMQN